MAAISTVSTRGAKYFCVINCSNNSKTSIDERTGRTVWMFNFPNPETERERCQKWVINIRRADVNISNIKRKQVCSVHFEEKAFNCPTNIQESRLLPTAVPTLVTCPNPPPSLDCRRPQPKKRDVIVAIDKRKRQHSDSDSEASPCTNSSNVSDVAPLDEPPAKEPRIDSDTLMKELEKTKQALDALKKENKSLQRKLKTSQEGKKKLKKKHSEHILQLENNW
ncbi:uncharacterized protein LOC143297433 [Babylonia areolata]|uniref:uncharacterized protein LOC143297433 n=1 Tax=Babylonia areolata TaxID=304850 RepID=UPI003FD17C04